MFSRLEEPIKPGLRIQSKGLGVRPSLKSSYRHCDLGSSLKPLNGFLISKMGVMMIIPRSWVGCKD